MSSMIWSKIVSFLVEAGKIAGGATFLFGIFYGTYQYIEAKQAKRVEEALTLYRQFNNTPLITHREEIYKVLTANQERIAAAAIVDEAELKKAITEMVKKDDVAKHLILVMDFFDGLVFCVSKNICDAETVIDLFHGRSRELYQNFYQYIHVQRSGLSSGDFGLGLQTIAEMKPRKQTSPQTAAPK